MSMSLEQGVEGVGWYYTDDGEMELNPDAAAVNMADEDKPLGNHGILLLTSDMFVDPTRSIEPKRGWAYDNIYKNYIPEESKNMPNVPSGMLEEMEVTTMSDLQLQITDYIKVTFATWITDDVDIDAEWDAFVNRMNELQVEEWVALKQKEIDNASKLS